MNRRRVLSITRRLMAGFRRDHRTLALLFVAPLLILTLLAWMLRGTSTPPAMGVVNQDQGPIGAAFTTQMLASTKVKASAMSLAEAESRLRDGQIVAYVVAPPDFTQSLNQRQANLKLRVEGSEPGKTDTAAQAVSEALSRTTGAQLKPEVSYLHGGPELDTLDYFGGAFIGLVVFFLIFVITCVAFLRERSQGTLERLMASPLRRGEVVIGYMLGFTILALVQAAEVLLFSLGVLHMHNQGSVFLIFTLEALIALAAVNLGIFLSMFARTEFEAVQFIPLVIVPQVLLSGVIFPVATEPAALQWLSNVLPLTYAVGGLRDVMLKGSGLAAASVQLDLAVVTGFAALMVVAAMTTLRRRIA